MTSNTYFRGVQLGVTCRFQELRDENDELRLQNEALTAQVNSSVKRRSSHRKRQPGDKGVSRHGSVVSDYIKPTVIRRNKDGVTSSDESDHDAANANGTVPTVRVSGDGGSNEDAGKRVRVRGAVWFHHDFM